MAYTINDGDVIQVMDWQQYCNQQCLTVWHYRVQGTGGVDGVTYLTALANDMITGPTGRTAVQRAFQLTDVTCNRYFAQKIWPIRYAPVDATAALPNGVIAGTKSPPNTAWSITRHVQEAGRGYQGRIQVVGWDYAWFLNGTIKIPAGFAAAVAAWLAQIPVSFSPTGFTLGVHPILFNAHKLPVTKRDVTSAQAQTTVRTMHRRTVGLGI